MILMNVMNKRAIMAAVLTAVTGAMLWAHPHVFMDTVVDVVGSGRRLEGVRIQWTFDKIFTATVLLDFDRNKDGALSPAEVTGVEQGAFSNLRNYHYFTFIITKDDRHEPVDVEQFNATVVDGRLRYTFFVPFRKQLASGWNELRVAVYDNTYFCAIDYNDAAPVRMEVPGGWNTSHVVRKTRDVTIDYQANDTSAASTVPDEILIRLNPDG
jgi:ABC-type uncharacterized transport system substrate-binding protein